MNKRQTKKYNKIVAERFDFFNRTMIFSGRQSGKSSIGLAIIKACTSKKYKYFKVFKKMYSKAFVAIDMSNGRDYSVKTVCRVSNGCAKIVSTEILD